MIYKFDTFLSEMAYPKQFDFNILKSLPDFKQKIKYVKSLLPKISQGSSRIVFQVDDEKVLKVAKNKLGLEQNANECEQYKQEYKVIAKVVTKFLNVISI